MIKDEDQPWIENYSSLQAWHDLREIFNAAKRLHEERMLSEEDHIDPVKEVFECLQEALDEYDRNHAWDGIDE